MKNKNEYKTISELKEGNRKAFNDIYFKYNRKIYGLARKFHLYHEDAEEIVQETFLILWRRHKQIDPDLSLDAYIYKITYSLIIKAFRKNTQRKAIAEYKIITSDTYVDTLSTLETKQLNELIKQYIDLLPDQRRKIFLMSRYQELSNEEIATKLNLSVRTVESHIYKSLKFLKQLNKEL